MTERFELVTNTSREETHRDFSTLDQAYDCYLALKDSPDMSVTVYDLERSEMVLDNGKIPGEPE
jgi:hypothetical protein